MRRLLSVAVVRTQTECLMSKLRQTGEGVAAANRRRGFPVMVGRRQGRKVERQGMFLLDRGTRATTGRGYCTSTFYLGRQ